MGIYLSPSFQEQERKRLKEALSYRFNLDELFRRLDADHTLVGAGVLYIDQHFNAVKLREFQPVCRIKPINIIIHEVPSGERAEAYATKLVQNRRESRLVGEAAGMVLSCGAAVLGWMVVAGSVGAVPVSGGTSTAITVLSYGAATASSIQCANGIFRTSSELGEGELNDWLDSQDWYEQTTKALDVVSLAGAGAAGLTAFKAYHVAKTASHRSTIEILKGMNRSERKRITEAIIRANNPGISNKAMKRLIAANAYPKRYSSSSINSALMLHVKDAIGATLSFSGSALSGTVNNLVIGVYEAI